MATKKAEIGVSLRKGQYKRLGKLAAKNPEKAEKVGKRMVERDTRVSRGKEFVKDNSAKLYPSKLTLKSGGKLKKYGKLKK
jgi:hypothetical protein